MTVIQVRRALIAVSDKSGLAAFAGSLSGAGAEIIASGGTAAAIEATGVAVTRVADVTGERRFRY